MIKSQYVLNYIRKNWRLAIETIEVFVKYQTI